MHSVKILKRLSVCLLSSGLCANAMAKDEQAGDQSSVPSPWAGSKVSLADIQTSSGNKSSVSIALKALLDYTYLRWNDIVNLSYKYGQTNKVVDVRRYSAENELQYSFNDDANIDNFVYIKASAINDDFAAFQKQDLVVAGYGRDWIKTDKYVLRTQVAPGLRETEPQDDSKKAVTAFATQISGLAKWQMTKTMSLMQTLDYTVGKPTNYLKSATVFQSSLTGALALNVEYDLDYYETPPSGSDASKIDTTTSLSLVYTFPT